MYFVTTIVLASIVGFAWGWGRHDWQMPYWALIASSLAIALIAELAERAVRRRRAARRPRAGRRAHARPTTKTTTGESA